MNINIKDCKVRPYIGTETMDIMGECEQAKNEVEGAISTQHTYVIAEFMANRDKVKIGDRVKLPAFTVPAVKMDGKEVMQFNRQNVKTDEAIIVGRDENGDFILIFDHCLFEVAIDLNNEKRFEMTQLGQYLQSEFLRAMNGAGIPAESCGLFSKEEMFGDNPLEYFKEGRNRIAFDFDEDCSRYYWLSTLYDEDARAVHFCYVSNYGRAGYSIASHVYPSVRPRFVISAI